MAETLEDTMARIRAQADRIVRDAGAELYRTAAEATPVRTGRAKANWNCTVNGSDSSFDDGTQFDSGKGQRIFSRASCGDTLIVENHIPYLPVLETGTLKRPSAGICDKVLDAMDNCSVTGTTGEAES